MERSIQEYVQICEWGSTHLFIFSDNVFGPLIYYSHLLPLLVSLLFALFVFFNNKKLLASRWLLVTAVLLAVWLFSDLVLWATEKPEYTMFFWSLVNMIEPMIYAAALFFVYALVDGKDISFKKKIVIFSLLLPTVILAPTRFNLSIYDLSNCWREAIEGGLPYYSYAVELLLSIWIFVYGLKRFFEKKGTREKLRVLLITAGTVFFLLSFAMGNVIGSLLVDWIIGQYGLFGIPVFIAVLSFLTVRYHAFNVKVISTQILVSAIWILTAAVLFLRDISSVRIIVTATLILFSFLGIALIRSVKREVEQREKIEKLAIDLKKTNVELEEAYKLQTEFLSFASHQIKNPLSGIKGYASLLIEGDYGELKAEVKDAVRVIFTSAQSLVETVQQFLDSTKIEQGGMKYDLQTLDLKGAVKDVVESLLPTAKEKGIELNVEINEAEEYKIKADRVKVRQVILNITDNAIKYTPKGSVNVSLVNKPGKVLFAIKDTGVGIEKAEIAKLFAKFARATGAEKVNVSGSGLGMYLAKKIVTGHGGRIWVESEGKGKGSQFYVEFDRV